MLERVMQHFYQVITASFNYKANRNEPMGKTLLIESESGII